MSQNTQKYRKLAAALLKWIIGFVAFWYIYQQIIASGRQDWWSAFESTFQDRHQLPWLFIAVILMPINWSLEAVKWKRLVQHLEQISFFTSFRAVCSGITVSMFTPNRIGEYAGRVFVLKSESRIQAAIATVIGSIGQLVVTVCVGTVATIAVSIGSQLFSAVLLVPILFLLSLISLLFLVFFIRIQRVSQWFHRLPMPASWKQHGAVFSQYPMSQTCWLLVISLLRYLVFSLQFYLLMRYFGVPVLLFQAFAGIAVVYLIMAIAPTFAITELGVRGSVALLVFSPMVTQTDGVVYAASLLWMINLIVPALVGCFFVFDFKLLHSNG